VLQLNLACDILMAMQLDRFHEDEVKEYAFVGEITDVILIVVAVSNY